MRSTTRIWAAFPQSCSALFPGGDGGEYPERPIEFIVPWGPGGGADQLARLVSKSIEPMLGQGIPVVNVPGGTGATGMAKLLAAPADGYAMAIYIADSHALLAGKDARWTMKDITPVAVMIQGPSFIFVEQDSPFKTWARFREGGEGQSGQAQGGDAGFRQRRRFLAQRARAQAASKFVQVPFARAERALRLDPRRPCRRALRAGRRRRAVPDGKQMRPILLFGEAAARRVQGRADLV